jgi:hypothetical protein
MPKTDDLPGVTGEGVSPKRIKKLDNAVELWRERVTARQAVLLEEIEARDNCVAIMHAEGLKTYRYFDGDEEQPRDLILDSTEKLKLKKVKTASSGNDEDEYQD